MPISGIVVALSADQAPVDAVRSELENRPEIDLGVPAEGAQPLVLETETRREHDSMCDWIRALPGVEHLDFVFFDCSEEDAEKFRKPEVATARR